MLPRAGVIHRALAMACFVGGLKNREQCLTVN